MFKQPEGLSPGIYYDLPTEEYHSDPALSSSGLKLLLENPALYWDSSTLNPDRESLDTKALKNGRAFHTLLLEPNKFAQEFTIKHGCKSSTIPGMVGEGDYHDMVRAAEVIHNMPSLKNLVRGGHPEVSIFWRDKETGVMCRCRYDYFHPWVGFDYKTTEKVTDKRKLGYSISDYGYDKSAGLYIAGLQSSPLYDVEKHLGFILLFQQKKRPYLARALRLDNRIIDIGTQSFRRGLEIYKHHIELYGSDPWPSGYEMVEDMRLEEMPFNYQENRNV